jgi:hypothetical protein
MRPREKEIVREKIVPQVRGEEKALGIFKQNPAKAEDFLTFCYVKMAEAAVAAYRELADDLWGSFTQYF